MPTVQILPMLGKPCLFTSLAIGSDWATFTGAAILAGQTVRESAIIAPWDQPKALILVLKSC